MSTVGIRALKQNASAVVSLAAAGEVVTVTDRGRPVVEIIAIKSSPLQRLLAAGRARPPRRQWQDLPAPQPGSNLSEELAKMRSAERY
ncbi:MAG: type II toxin-antitoxin system prevent-host-death family antitoxin [Propionibacteriaceae bacterium]